MINKVLCTTIYVVVMSEIPTITSSGVFFTARYGLEVHERVMFDQEVSEKFDFDVRNVIAVISAMEINPCEECPTLNDAIRLLATVSGIEPEDAKKFQINCEPDDQQDGFYKVEAAMAGKTRSFGNVRCKLKLWMSQNLPKKSENAE